MDDTENTPALPHVQTRRQRFPDGSGGKHDAELEQHEELFDALRRTTL